MDFLKTQIDVEEKNLEAASTELQKLQGEPRNLIFLQNGIEGKYIDLNKYQSLANQARYEYQQTLAGRNSLRERLIEVPATIIVNSTDSTDPREEINPAYESLNEALIRKEMDLAEKTAQLESALGISLILESEIRTLQAEASEKKLTMDRLQDTLDRSKKTFNLLNEKWTQTQIIQAVNTGETYLIPVSPASVPTSPVKPKKMLNMTIAGILGLMASIMLAFVLEFLDNTVKDADDIQKIFNLPVIGNIPVIDDLDQEPKNRNDRQKLGHGEENYPWSKAIT
jgi:capsular polysaccharide biosynthesis protein